ncbi:MAG: protein kinase, partial [Pseudomonadota bacterium]
EAIKLGAFEFLEKPMKQEALAAVIGDAMVTCEPSALLEETRDELSLKIDVAEPRTAKKPPPPPPDVARGAAVIGPLQDVQIPEKIGRYVVLGVIGKGGMGTVFKCQDPMLKREVAVKVLHIVDDVPEHQQELINRFKREAAAAATLTHPSIVGVYDMGQDEISGAWFIVMELLQGRGLHVVLDEKQILFESEVVTLGFHLADALAHAHAAGVVHRDIKPSNILIQADGSAKLVDFGLAAVRGWKVTVGGRVFGSPSYMSPERIKGEPGTAQGDQFSLGTVLYECLAGDNPFDGDSLEAKVLRLLQHDPPAIGDFIPTVPEKLSTTLKRMLSKSEGDRFPKMDEVVELLQEVGKEFELDLKPYKPPTVSEN